MFLYIPFSIKLLYILFLLGYEDFLQSPLQPLMDNLESSTYEVSIIYQKIELRSWQDEEILIPWQVVNINFCTFRCLKKTPSNIPNINGQFS